jgi:hypothetical protein
MLFVGVGTCLQVLLAGNEYFVFWSNFTSRSTQYCEVEKISLMAHTRKMFFSLH